MKAKKISVFYICLLIVVILVVSATQIGKFYLKDVLTEYENSQYKYTAEDFFKNNFSDSSPEALAELFKSQVAEYETEERFATHLSKITSNNTFSFNKAASGISDEIKYSVNCGNEKFATFSLEKSDEKSKKGFDLFRPSSVLFNENLFNTAIFELPMGYSLYINGFLIDDKFIIDKFDFDVSAFSDEIESIEYLVYSVPKLCDGFEYTVNDSDGANAIVSEQDGVFRADVSFDKTNDIVMFEGIEKEFSDEEAKERGSILETEYSTYVIDATKAYAQYMQKDANFGKVSKYLDSSSDIYDTIRLNENWMVISHFANWFEDEKVFDFYAYSDDVFSCRITITQVLRYSESSGNSQKDITKDYRDYIDITWLLRKVNGKYLICDSYTH